MTAVVEALADAHVIAKRNVIKIKRVPEVLVWVLMSPIMFVLLFAYVFGEAIDPGAGLNYREFLIVGIFAQTVVFGSTFTGAGIAEDMSNGIIDRFRSLPMSQGAVLIGRTASDVIYNVLSIAIMSITGLLVGWRIRGSLLDAVLAYGLLLLFAYSFSWVMAFVGHQQRLVHGHHADDVRVERLRAARAVPDLAPAGGRVEPGVDAHPGGARAVRQRARRPGGPVRRVVDAAPRPLHAAVDRGHRPGVRPAGGAPVPALDTALRSVPVASGVRAGRHRVSLSGGG
jgi:hypothetical protein